MDAQVTIHQLKETFQKFSKERGWDRLNDPKDLSMDIVSEATELMDLFLFKNDREIENVIKLNREEIEHETADIAFALLNFCTMLDIDLSNAVERKLKITAQKYPPIL